MINTVNIFISLAVLWVGTFLTNDVSGEDSLSYVAAVYEHKPSMLYLTGGDAWEDIENNLQIYEEQIKVAAAKVRHIIIVFTPSFQSAAAVIFYSRGKLF